jgi:hypothetical protein
MVRATFELSGNTFTFGALGGDAIMMYVKGLVPEDRRR